MKKLLLAALVFLCVCAESHAQMLLTGVGSNAAGSSALPFSSKWITSYGAGALNVGAVRYFTPMGHTGVGQSTENLSYAPVPIAGTATAVFTVATAPDTGGGTQQYTFALRANSGNLGTCVIAEAATTCSISTPVSYSANDLASIGATPSGTPNATQASWVVSFTPTAANTFITMSNIGADGNGSTLMVSTSQFVPLLGGGVFTSTSPRIQAIAAGTYTVPSWCTQLNVAPGGTASRTFDLTVDGRTMGQPITYGTAESGLKCATFTPEFPVYPQDFLVITSTVASPNAAASAFSTSVVWKPQTNGDFLISGNSNTVSNATPGYIVLAGTKATTGTETSAIQTPVPATFSIKEAAARISTSPGASKSYEVVLRANAADASTPFTMTLAGAQVNALATPATFTPSAADLLNTEITPTSTPTAVIVGVGLTGHVTVAGPGNGQANQSANLLNDMHSGTIGNTITAAVATADSYGYGGGYSVSAAFSGFKTCANTWSAGFKVTQSVRNASYTGASQANAYCYDHTANPDETLIYGGTGNISAPVWSTGYFFKTTLTGNTGNVHDQHVIDGNTGASVTTCVVQLNDNTAGGAPKLRAHGSSAGAGSTVGLPDIQLVEDTWYYVTKQADGVNGTCKMKVYDPSNNYALVGENTGENGTTAAAIDAGSIFSGTHLGDNAHTGFGAGTTTYFGIIEDWLDGTFPLGF